MQLVANVLLGRVLGASGVGVYYTFDAWQRTAALVAGVGMPSLTLRSVSRLWASRPGEALGATLRYVLIATGVAAAAATVLAAAADPIARTVLRDPGLAPVLVWSGVSAVLFIAVRILAQALKGTERPAIALSIEFGMLPTGLVGSLAVLHVANVPVTPLAIVLAHVVSLGAATAVGAWVTFATTRSDRADEPADETDGGTGLPIATLAYFWGTGVAQMVFTTLPIILLPLFATQADVGFFGVSTKLLAASGVAISALSSYYSPRFAVHAEDPHALRRLLGASQRASLALFAPFFVVFVIFPELVLGVFGPGFAEGATILRVLAVGQLISSGVGLIGYFASMIGMERLTFHLLVASLAVLLLGTWILGSRFGGVGVAAATALAVTFRSTSLYLVARARLGGGT